LGLLSFFSSFPFWGSFFDWFTNKLSFDDFFDWFLFNWHQYHPLFLFFPPEADQPLAEIYNL